MRGGRTLSGVRAVRRRTFALLRAGNAHPLQGSPMLWSHLLRRLLGRAARPSRSSKPSFRRKPCPPALEPLEDRVTPTGLVAVFAGGGNVLASSNPVVATQVQLNQPQNVAVDGLGNVYIADFLHNEVDKVDTSGKLTVFAGGGASPPSTTPTTATQVRLTNATGVAVDASGNVYIAGHNDQKVEKVGTNGKLTVIAGGGTIAPSTTP